MSRRTDDDEEELENLYQSVLNAYSVPQPQPPPAIRLSSSSGSARTMRPLPPTPGGAPGRTPIVPNGTPTQSLPALPESRPGSSASGYPMAGPPPEAGPSRGVSPQRSVERPTLEITTTTLDEQGGSLGVQGPSNPHWSAHPTSPSNEYDLPEVNPVPMYVERLAEDLAAANTAPLLPGVDDPYLHPHRQYSDDRDSYESTEDSFDASFDEEPRVPHDEEERPVYEETPSYPGPIYHPFVPPQPPESVDDRESEMGTMISDNYSILRRPPNGTPPVATPTEESHKSPPYSASDLPYTGEELEAYYSPGIASSSWQAVSSPSIVEVRAPPRPRTPPVERNDAGPSRNTPARRLTYHLAQVRDFDPTYPELEPYPDDIVDDSSFVNYGLLSNIAVQLQLKVPRGNHVKGSVPYSRAFTGKDIVTTIHSILEQKLIRDHDWPKSDRRVALQVARSLQKQLFFVEVEWVFRLLQDGVEDVYKFLDDPETTTLPERAELPTGVVTMLTGCYSVMCEDGGSCYSGSCPRKGMAQFLPQVMEEEPDPVKEDWTKGVPAQVLRSLSDAEINRQTIIHKLIDKEEQYIRDLDIVETVFIQPLRKSPVIPLYMVDEFIDEVFGNILELRDCNRRLIEIIYVRQREEAPIIKTIGDIFLDIATQFRKLYPVYVGRRFLAEKRLKQELDDNPEFRLFVEHCERQLSGARAGEHRLDLWHYLNRPTEHLQKYPVLLEAVYQKTSKDNPDGDFLSVAIAAIIDLQNVARLQTFQSAMDKGAPAKWQWHDLVTPKQRRDFTTEESQRQGLIFELIKSEMAYVRDLENIETIFRQPLMAAEPPIIPPDRLDQFLQDVFHNLEEVVIHHRRLVETLHEIQLEQHPRITSITAAIFDAALNFREAYMEYIPNSPIATYRIEDEMRCNPTFRAFVQNATRHPDAFKRGMKEFINLPNPRLLRYELLLKEIQGQTPMWHQDRDAIPEVIETIQSLVKETQPGVDSAKQKVEVWTFHSQLVFKPGEAVDMDLLNEHRSLVHTGTLLVQEEGQWVDLFVMLFDNYLVLSKQKETAEGTKYHVARKPIPLDLLYPVNFNEPVIIRNPSRFRSNASISSRTDIPDARNVYPFTLHYTGRQGTNFSLSADSPHLRNEWKLKLEEALGLRKAVADSNKIFEIETLSNETFLVPPVNLPVATPLMQDGFLFTGRVTCSVPFKTGDNRGLVAIGCAEGVWIGFRSDPRSLRRVLHVRNVTQCAMLEDFGIFLVLADKNLLAYHIEALVPNPLNPQPYTSQSPQKVNGSKEVLFFSIGMQHGRTLVIYMNKRGSDSAFHVVEPVIDKITERPKASSGGLNLFNNRQKKSNWFRPYRDFFLQGESFDMIFLKAKLAVLCAKGFEIVDLTDFKTVTIPQKDNPALGPAAKRCDVCRPMAIFRSSEDEFLLCYNEFGIYIDKHGIPSRNSGAIEWEGTAERLALHAPYILIFDSRFIEIRHMDTCRLSQIIPGNDLRCIWDGRGIDISHAAVPADASEETFIQEPRVHAVMSETAPQPGGRGIRGISQHVFQLVPTIPLYLPGSLSSPPHISYYNHFP